MIPRWCRWLGCFLLLGGTLRAQLVISEVMARNGTSLADSDGAYSDWIELHNSATNAVGLEGWYLTDTATNRMKWRFPAQTLGADAYMVVFASGKNRTPVSGALHTNFKLSSAGSYLALVQPDGQTIATEFAPAYSPQATDVSFGLNQDPDGNHLIFFEHPTPRAPNAAAWPARAGPVDFSRPGGLFTNAFTVLLSSAEPGAQIRYSLDGSIPTPFSALYSGPITIDRTLRVRARVFRDGYVPGPVSGAAYTQVAANLRAFSSNLPQLIVDTYGRDIADGVRTICYVTLITTNGGRATLPGAVDVQSRGGIEIRGSSSTSFPKHSYGLELDGEDGTDQAASLLGLPAESDWVLYAPYTDKSLIRDVLAYELSNRIGRYAPRTRFVELYVNRSGAVDAGDYQGVYVLIEKLKGGRNRVNITGVQATDYTEPDVTGGYLLKKDRLDATDAPFTTSHGQQLGFEWPKPRELGSTQTLWIRGYLNRFEAALYGPRFRDPTAGYGAYLDPGSFIDHHWLVEVAKNIDGFRLSTFMFKDRNERLNLGPIWDYNLTFGNANYLEAYQTNGWYWSQLDDTDYPWFRRLFQDPEFAQRYTDRWVSLRTNVLATDNVLALVSSYTNLLAEAQVRNYKHWPILGTYVWPNYYIGNTYEDEIGFLKDWIAGRLAWIDSTILPWPQISRPAGYYPGGVLVEVTATNAVYYTLDGSDPRAPGGSLSAQALRYSAPLDFTANAQIVARARNGSRWSPPVSSAYAVTIPDLRITELMYHPAAATGSGPFGSEEFEFIELRNMGTNGLPLGRFILSGGVQFQFPAAAGDIWPGENVLVVRNRDAFVARYGDSARIVGQYSGHLANGGDRLVLTGPLGEPVLDFKYDDQWHPATDGQGYSLTFLNPRAAASDWSVPGAWTPSIVAGGTPGRNDVPGANLAGLRLQFQDAGAGAQAELEFEAAAGQTYALQYTTDLLRGSWLTLTNFPPPEVTGAVRVRLEDDPLLSRAFRVITPWAK